LASLAGIGAMVAALFIVTALMTLFSWKLSLGADLLCAGAGLLWWGHSRGKQWPFRLIPVSLVGMAIAAIVLFSSMWRTQAAHDAHLGHLVDELCGLELPQGTTLEDCRASITNTGNGNSCQYWARAELNTTASTSAVAEYLEDQGFSPTTLNVWREPIEDGRTYWSPTAGEFRIFLMESWRPDEGDLRCT
jgi:hypothetical protein